MNITLEITPEVEAVLARKAQLAGQALETYAAELLGEAVHVPAAQAGQSEMQPKPNLDEFLQQSPLWGSGLVVERQKDYPRPVEL